MWVGCCSPDDGVHVLLLVVVVVVAVVEVLVGDVGRLLQS